MTKTKDQQISEAFATLNAIEVLEGVPEFVKFIERMKERVEIIEAEILEVDMPADKREGLRQRRFGMFEVIGALDADRAGAKKFLASQGIMV